MPQYSVPLIPQLTNMGCWAASIAMVVNWATNSCIDPSTIAARNGYTNKLSAGLAPDDDQILRDWGFATEAPQTFTVAGFMQLLQQYGPLWVAGTVGPLPAHVRVVTGFDPNPDPTLAVVYINDPWQQGMTNFSLPNPGSQYTMDYVSFAQQQDTLETRPGGNWGGVVAPVYVAHMANYPYNASGMS